MTPRTQDAPSQPAQAAQPYVGKRAARTAAVETEPPATPYVGRRVARAAEPLEPVATPAEVAPAAPVPPVAEPVAVVVPPATVEIAALAAIAADLDGSAGSARAVVPGKRRAAAASRRSPFLRGLPPLPLVAGVATIAIAVGGVVTTSDDTLLVNNEPRALAANAAAGGAEGSGTYDALDRGPVLSRDSQRDALDDATDADLIAEAEQQAAERDAALGNLAEQAEREAREINLNRWVLPTSGYRLTARFGECSGLWSSCHTGLDFATSSGTTIVSVANGVVTSTEYDGSYGNKTVITLDDGTEIWYCHQTAFAVEVGDTVVGGQPIGYVGSTGNSTGPHLHLEVRPGGGDPVDPYAALIAHGVTP